jgi:hypothetical protein
MRKIVSTILVGLMTVAMITLLVSPAIATKPRTMTLSGMVWVPGSGTGTVFPAGSSSNLQNKFREVPFALTGSIRVGEILNPYDPTQWIPGGLYDGNMLVKPSGDVVWHGTWTMENAYVVGIGTGSLHFGSEWNPAEETAATWWITGATGDLSGLKGRGTATPVMGDFLYAYEFEVQIS